MDNADYTIERRRSPRIKTKCVAELTASVSLLDSAQPDGIAPPLVLMGETQDISANGVSVILPSIRIDEKCCEQSRSVLLALRLSASTVQLQAQLVRCVPLEAADPSKGYMLAAEITDVNHSQHKEFRDYLQTLMDLP